MPYIAKNIDYYYVKDQYLNFQRSSYNIAKELKCSYKTITNILYRVGVQPRKRGLCQHLAVKKNCNWDDFIKDFLIGETLGDGCIHLTSEYSGKFSYGCSKKEYLQWIINILNSYNIEQAGRTLEYSNNSKMIKDLGYGDRQYKKYCYSSKSYEELKTIYDFLYEDGRKILPSSLSLSPIILRQFFIGDGCLVKREKRNPNIVISTMGFDTNSLNNLVTKLNEIGVKATVLKNKVTRISSKSTNKFFEYIGKCPDEICSVYGYKWI